MMTTSSSSSALQEDARFTKDKVLALKQYRENLTWPRNRIPETVLQVTDPAFPETSITREQAREQMIASRHLLPADQAIQRFNLTNTSGTVIGDQVFLTIYVYPNTSTYTLDPLVTSMSNRKEKYHFAEAWVDVSNLERLAASESVRGMELVEYIEHS